MIGSDYSGDGQYAPAPWDVGAGWRWWSLALLAAVAVVVSGAIAFSPDAAARPVPASSVTVAP